MDNGVAQSADGSLLLNRHLPPSPSEQRHMQENVEEEEEGAEFLNFDDDDLNIEVEITQAMMQHLRDLFARERHHGGAGVEGAMVSIPASGAAVPGLEKQAFRATVEGCGAVTGCTICLDNFEDGEEVTVMPCFRGHEFHPDCITKWLGKNNTCPLCRHALPTDVLDDGL